MLPVAQKIAFLIFALITGAVGIRGFYRLYRRIAAGRSDSDARWNHLPARAWYALKTTLTQSRTFRKRPVVSLFHSFIFYGFTFYLLVNLVDAIDGYVPLSFASLGVIGNIYVLFADVLSFLVLVGVIALVVRRFALPSRTDFSFNDRTLLHKDVQQQYISRDSIIVSAFILFHVGSRAIGAGAKIALDGPNRFAPFATLLSYLFTPQNSAAWRDFGYWGALGSVLLFLAYFPFTKHVHIFMAPLKYLVARDVSSGVLPAVVLDMEAETPQLGAEKLEDLAWPRLLDAYACIQCNRCQDVCPATATGKALSPSALEINKRMELNELSKHQPSFEQGAASPHPLLTFALSPEAAWACTTCGACLDVCPVQDEPMLDIIDIRRQQVMIASEFPAQLQTAFRGMERAKNPWGINHDKRLDWAAGLNVKTTDENPEPDVLYWVGCAASYDPQSQKTARAFVQLLDHAGVDFAVLGKRECCTGDSARRAGNEYLYRQLADENVTTLNEIKPKLIVATCPHCMNTVGKEYKQLGGDYKVMHHTEYLASLVAEGKLSAETSSSTVTYHDPCYLGRHNGVYDAPRNVLNVLSNSVVELPRNRENSFCCGAGGAQFWKEEEPGTERISENRLREVEQRLEGAQDKVLAVGCPFCKSMLGSSPGQNEDTVAIRDVAELLLEGVQRRFPKPLASMIPVETIAPPEKSSPAVVAEPQQVVASEPALVSQAQPDAIQAPAAPTRKVWVPKKTLPTAHREATAEISPSVPAESASASSPSEPEAMQSVPATRQAWAPKKSLQVSTAQVSEAIVSQSVEEPAPVVSSPEPEATQAPAVAVRKAWVPKKTQPAAISEPIVETAPMPDAPAAMQRKKWTPKAKETSGEDKS